MGTLNPRGFTLIELLIVVAIIAILAAIAVPNFLEAQMRAKVSRVLTDHRTIVVALESYHVDNNGYPIEWRNEWYAEQPLLNNRPAFAVLPPNLSTPVAYMTNVLLEDPFSQLDTSRGSAPDNYYGYYDLKRRATTNRGTGTYTENAFTSWYGEYRLLSNGPDRDFWNLRPSSTNIAQVLYDASNGTISGGNIWRSPKNDRVQPPVGPLVPPH